MDEYQYDDEKSSKKRKLEDSQAVATESLEKHKIYRTSSPLNANLNLEMTPPTWEWQRCLDIKCGHVYLYNTRTRKKYSPRFLNQQPELPNSCGMSLELDLNLPCGSARKNGNNNSGKDEKETSDDGVIRRRCPSWLAIEGDEKEMVTAVCNKCHMLVMMCKSCPACPNCKFVHPPDHNLLSLFAVRAPNVKEPPLVLKTTHV